MSIAHQTAGVPECVVWGWRGSAGCQWHTGLDREGLETRVRHRGMKQTPSIICYDIYLEF